MTRERVHPATALVTAEHHSLLDVAPRESSCASNEFAAAVRERRRQFAQTELP
jgi:hypothetical protein